MKGGGILITVEGITSQEVNQLAPILQSFMQSYANKPDDVKVEDWIATELQNHLTDKSAEEVQSITFEIIQGVDSFSQNLESLNEACENGTTKEAWFAHQLKLAYENNSVDMQTFGQHLFQSQLSLFRSNQSIIEAMQSKDGAILKPLENENIEGIKVNELGISNLALLIAKQSSLSGVANATLDYGVNLALSSDNLKPLENAEIIYKALYSGKDEDIKKSASVALVVAQEKRILPPLPDNIPQYLQVRTLAGITSLGIENTKIFGSLAVGSISSLRALECFSRNAISLFASISCEKIGAGIGASLFSFVPVVGTAMGAVVGGLVGRMVDNKIAQTLKKGVEKIKPIAKTVVETAWNVAKSTVKTTVSTVYSGIKSVCSC